jgi:hypothetical protein
MDQARRVTSRFVLSLALALAAMPALADTGSVIVPMPASPLYVSECGACHTAYAPTYLPARSWHQLMAELDHHFGEDASLGNGERDLLESQLRALALDSPHADPGIAARNGAAWMASSPQRISTSPFFHYLHDEVPNSIWQRPAIVSKANCVACHPRASEGRYLEPEIRIPK